MNGPPNPAGAAAAFSWHHLTMGIGVVERAAEFAGRVALCDELGGHSYAELLAASAVGATALAQGFGGDLAEGRVAYKLEPGFRHVATQWAIWRAGGVAVPLAPSYPAAELERLIDDARPIRVIDGESVGLVDRPEAFVGAGSLSAASPVLPPAFPSGSSRAREDIEGAARWCGEPHALDPGRRAMMVYTSGTTGRPKGVVTTHANLEAQTRTLVDAWEWRANDRILHVLPLHHVHGIVNALCCALWVGACCEFSSPDPRRVWDRLASGEITLFMAVPTIYRRLIAAWESAPERTRERWAGGSAGLRLMVSGSAALPVETLERWQEITGHRLLERYGMTEIGMALGNPLHGERRAGTVGQPFAGVEARIVDEEGGELAPGEQGQVEVRGPQVFLEYWDRPQETRDARGADGWFRTGDEGVVEDGYWRLVGRRSVDIIKTGGYKVSALEIEAVLRQHASVEDAAVVGIPDDEWGERVCAAVIAASGAKAAPDDLRAWCKERLAPYKVPKQLVVVDALPRNAMGKVTKPALVPVFSLADP